MSLNYKNSLILLSFLVVAGCAKKQAIKSTQNNNLISIQTSVKDVYKLDIEGVECKFCAQKVVRALEEISGVKKAEFVCFDTEFKNYFVKLYLNKDGSIDSEKIKERIEKLGFEFKQVMAI